MIEAHEQSYKTKLERGLIPDEQWAVEAPLYVEGMALLRLAAKAGLPALPELRLIPSLVMDGAIPTYQPDDWRQD